MTLSSLLHALFASAAAADAARAEAHRELRSAIHASRNEALKAIATARLGARASDDAYAVMAETIRRQEQTGGGMQALIDNSPTFGKPFDRHPAPI